MQRLWLGGSFNPVHYGHLYLAQQLSDALDAEVSLLPSAQSAFGKELADDAMRVTMLKRALDDFPYLKLDTREVERQGVSYTIDTLTQLRHEYGANASLGFVLGEDALYAFDKWKQPRAILQTVKLLVLLRGTVVPQDHRQWLDYKAACLRLLLAPPSVQCLIRPSLAQTKQQWQNTRHESVLFWHNKIVDISATRVRQLAAQGEWDALASLVPPSVLDYLREVQPYSPKKASSLS